MLTIKKCLPACLLFLLAAALSAQTPPVRRTINFDEDWKFHFGHAADVKKDFNYGIPNIFAKTSKSEGTALDAKFDDANWQKVQLPHDWAVALPFENSTDGDVMGHGYKPVGGLFPETSIGWYRKTFNIARSDSSNRFVLRFDGIYRNSKVWVNGFYLGTNESGYIGISYDISDYLFFDKPNLVTVRVDATQYEGWFYEGAGIYRHVWLEQYHPLHFAEGGVFVHSEVRQNAATVNLEMTIQRKCKRVFLRQRPERQETGEQHTAPHLHFGIRRSDPRTIGVFAQTAPLVRRRSVPVPRGSPDTFGRQNYRQRNDAFGCPHHHDQQHAGFAGKWQTRKNLRRQLPPGPCRRRQCPARLPAILPHPAAQGNGR
jgi:hypothetical protein